LNKKKILIIGQSPNVFDHEWGEQIDRFDGLIARCNLFKIKGYEKHVGTRTDVLCAGGYRIGSEQANGTYEIVLWLSAFEEDTWSYCRLMADHVHKNIVTLTRKEFRDIMRALKLDWYPTTGMRAIYYFFKRGYKVFIYGFDFCFSGKEYCTNDPLDPMKGHHEPKKEKDYVDKLVKDKKLFWFKGE
jgi:hypothetical protein